MKKRVKIGVFPSPARIQVSTPIRRVIKDGERWIIEFEGTPSQTEWATVLQRLLDCLSEVQVEDIE